MADERDPKLSQRYRELEALEPSAELDRKILAAAHAAEAPHAPLVAPAGRHRWYYSLAAAAVLVFAVALTLHIERDRPDPESAAPAAPLQREQHGEIKAAAQAESKPVATPEAKAAPRARAEGAPAFTPDPQRAAGARLAEGRMRDEQAAATAAATEARAAAEMRARRDAPAKQQAASSPRPAAAPLLERQNVDALASRREAAGAQRVAPAPAAAQMTAAPENPERWLERIAGLRSRGEHAVADRELAAFRKAYPDYRLSDLMRERVEKK